MTPWEAVGSVPPRELSDARLQLHWAAQLPAAVGAALVPKRPDDSHTALECIPERSLLSGSPTDAPEPRRIALSLADLRIVVLDDDLEETDGLTLAERSLEDGLGWLSSVVGVKLALPTYDMPAHAVAAGRLFTMNRPEAFAELARWYRNAARILGRFDPNVLCWPHHFDIAVLTTEEPGKTIGIGVSPGDGNYDEPYWYVTPWPYPETTNRPPLANGHWHDEGFVAAILAGTELVELGAATQQADVVDAFLDSAIRGARKLLT
jgi:hypothetical protein